MEDKIDSNESDDYKEKINKLAVLINRLKKINENDENTKQEGKKKSLQEEMNDDSGNIENVEIGKDKIVVHRKDIRAKISSILSKLHPGQ